MDKIGKLQKMINEANNIVFFGGAGVSTASGIKDFRGKDGLYNTKYNNKYNPEYMLSSKCFYNDMDNFYEYYKKNMNCLDAEPNVTHIYLKKLEDCGKLKAIITQNIDGLHQKAGSKKVYELHGTIHRNYCIICNKQYTAFDIFTSVGVPKCDCGGLIKPDVVLYGEMLPDDFIRAQFAINKADMLIVAGSSLTVQPASSLVSIFSGKNLVIINNEKTPYDNMADLVINENLEDVFKKLTIKL